MKRKIIDMAAVGLPREGGDPDFSGNSGSPLSRGRLRNLILSLTCLALLSCAHTSKQPGAKPFKKISEKGNSIYYYIVSQLEQMGGAEEDSLFHLDKSLKKNPSSLHLMTEKAYTLARKNKLDDALKVALKAYTKAPDNLELNIVLGKIYSAQANHTEAIRYLKKALTIDATNERIYELLGRVYITNEEFKEAIAVFKKLQNLNPEYPGSYYYLGTIYSTHEKNFPKALDAYQGLLEMSPDDPKVLNLIAELYLAEKDHKRALETFLKIRQLTPGDLRVWMRVALLYYEMDDVENAIRSFEEILEQEPHSDKIIYYLGMLYQEKKDYTAALNYFGDVPEVSGFYTDSVSRQIYLYNLLKQTPKAIAVAKLAVRKSPATPEFYELLAGLHLQGGEPEEAIRLLKSGVHRLPQNEKMLFTLAALYEQTGDWRQGVLAMQRVLALNDKNPMALNFVGYTFAENGERLDEAQELIERALALKPNDGLIKDSLGWVFFQKGQLRKALDLLEQANKLSPNEPAILEHLGDAYLKFSNKRQARLSYEAALFALKKKPAPSQRDQAMIERIAAKMGQF